MKITFYVFKIHLKESYSPEFLLDRVLYFAEGDIWIAKPSYGMMNMILSRN